ncbi:SOS response-associated peptidase [Jatrophihabitans endophyticus]|uniref:SOS response-associated peptidase n=1 Tax=Jatrophihabitans endophyticus TaxID=1206085 RepID=UPI0034CF21B2
MSVAADSDLTLEFDVEVDDVIDAAPPPSWNVAPTDPARIVVERRPHGADDDAPAVHQLRTARWGLVPGWSRDAKGGARMINARIETVTQKPAFKKAAARRRCLVPATGYYEWQRTDAGKTPYFLHDADGELLSFAGLYELWRDPSKDDDAVDRWLWTYTIITQEATDLLGEIHDRNPVVVPVDAREAWLDCGSDDPSTAQALLDAFAPARLEPYEVGTAVGNVRNNGPELVEPVEAQAEQQALDL